MKENRTAFMHGEPITLLGKELSIGDPAPDFLLLDTGKTKRSLKDYEGTIKLISAVPSLDTGVCDAQTRRFNKEAADFSDHVTVLTVSMDLPFAQSRWCGAAGIDRVITLSDHYDGNFGLSYGILIEELRLENRAVFIVDEQNIIRYIEVLSENTEHPDYDRAIAALKQLI
ncbi:MAG: thiol peroxidase [Spirochaetia bacterium]|nr:thiol peroxidase [Spirochaetia bacterium]MCF7941727.1 thiol peroxidase [Spirochaetia bacterium]